MAAAETGLSAVFERLLSAAAGLPGVVETTSYGTPSLKVGKKMLARVKDAGTAVLCCAREEKEVLIAAAPDIYFETTHYQGWPLVLVRTDVISDAELRHRMLAAFRLQATKTLLRHLDGPASGD